MTRYEEIIAKILELNQEIAALQLPCKHQGQVRQEWKEHVYEHSETIQCLECGAMLVQRYGDLEKTDIKELQNRLAQGLGPRF